MTAAADTWPRPGSDCAAVLAELERTPGEWVADLYDRTRCMVHSRIADLRKRGYVIESERFASKDYRYRLVAAPVSTSTPQTASTPSTVPMVEPGEQASLFAPPPRERVA